jgi:hypothetical protein
MATSQASKLELQHDPGRSRSSPPASLGRGLHSGEAMMALLRQYISKKTLLCTSPRPCVHPSIQSCRRIYTAGPHLPGDSARVPPTALQPSLAPRFVSLRVTTPRVMIAGKAHACVDASHPTGSGTWRCPAASGRRSGRRAWGGGAVRTTPSRASSGGLGVASSGCFCRPAPAVWNGEAQVASLVR